MNEPAQVNFLPSIPSPAPSIISVSSDGVIVVPSDSEAAASDPESEVPTSPQGSNIEVVSVSSEDRVEWIDPFFVCVSSPSCSTVSTQTSGRDEDPDTTVGSETSYDEESSSSSSETESSGSELEAELERRIAEEQARQAQDPRVIL